MATITPQIATGDVKNKFNNADKTLRDEARNLGGSIEEASHIMGERAGALASQVASSVNEYVKNGREYVQENPAKGVAIAAAAGLVTGSLLTMAFRSRKH